MSGKPAEQLIIRRLARTRSKRQEQERYSDGHRHRSGPCSLHRLVHCISEFCCMRGCSRGADPGSLGPLSTHAGVTVPGYNAEIRAYYDCTSFIRYGALVFRRRQSTVSTTEAALSVIDLSLSP